MKIADKIVNNIISHVKDKNILEVACGEASFSLSVSKYANTVIASDIEGVRIDRIPKEIIPSNLSFMIMDASKLKFNNDHFDTAVSYNALSHLGVIAIDVVNEMLRVVKNNGKVILIGTWKIENPMLNKIKLELIKNQNCFIEEIGNDEAYRALIISKNNEEIVG